jgi:RHS repeat-associated protein
MTMAARALNQPSGILRYAGIVFCSLLVNVAQAADTESTTSAPTALLTAPLAEPPATVPGQTATLLPDGRWLMIGGEVSGQLSNRIEFKSSTQEEAFPATLFQARRGHTATVLPTGAVLVVGGTGSDGELIQNVELIDLGEGAVIELASTGLGARTQHTATVLTNGQLLIAGGRDAEGNVLSSAQLWDPRTGTLITDSNLQIARFAHEAGVLSSGESLLWGGRSASSQILNNGEIYNPSTNVFEGPVGQNDARVLSLSATSTQAPSVADTVPPNDALDVPLDSLLGIRFSRPLPMAQLNATHIVLVGPAGSIAGTVVGAERGMLAFFTPSMELSPATTYTLFISGLVDAAGRVVPSTSIRITTHRIVAPIAAHPVAAPSNTPSHTASAESSLATTGSVTSAASSPPKIASSMASTAPKPTVKTTGDTEMAEDWIPQVANRRGAWRVLGLTNDPPLKSTAVSLLHGTPNQTAIAGRVLRLNGLPLGGVSVGIGAHSTTTDAQGRFLLSGMAVGVQQLKVDGTAVTISGRHYTEHYLRVSVSSGTTTTIPNPIYLPRVDPATEVSLSSPADHEIVLTHPAIPGLEVHIPQGAVIREQGGKVVTKVSITPIPVDRAPYPTPVQFSAYFTLQPGGAYVDGDPSKAIQIIYPNYQGLPAGSVVNFWNYDPTAGGWQVYGHGKVTADGQQVRPDVGVGFRQIMSFGFGEGPNFNVVQNVAPQTASPVGGCPASKGGDPVDCATGLFLHQVTDMVERDVIPISVTRLYRQNDNVQRLFGVGNNLSYGMWLNMPTCNQCTAPITLVLADGGQVNYYAVSGANVYPYVNTDSPSAFQGSTLSQYQPLNGTNEWQITLKDGSTLGFENAIPYQLTSIIDRNGNRVSITLEGNLITQVTSPNGRYLQFFYDSYNRITQAIDNIGRSAFYAYDSAGRLTSATDADGNTESYGYDPVSNGMSLVADKRGNAMVQNVFDANGRVTQQTLADGAVWQFAYSLDNSTGAVVQTTVTDPRNQVRQDTFNTSGYVTQSVHALGAPEQQTYTFQRNSSNEVVSEIDPLGRQTVMAYDRFGDVTSLTRLYGTSGAVTYGYTYDPIYHELTSYTDPLGHTTTIDHDGHGNIVSVTDALNDVTAIANNSEGLPAQITDPLGHSTQMGYSQADLSSVTDALGRTTNLFTDSVGRLLSVKDPLGNQTQYGYDAMDRMTSVIDALNEVRSRTYDQNGNLLTASDPRGVTHTFTYDPRNRRQTYQDPLGNSESYAYDGMGNLTSHTDRKGQVTQITYDALDRPILITYQDSSTVAITWDAGNRPTQLVDSTNGTITHQYDLLDRLTQESTPQGQVNYTYDAAGRRSSMMVAGQAAVNYTFDNANRLTQVVQASTVLAFGYDAAGRRTSVTLPNGILGTFGFDGANEIMSISYANGSMSVGNLAYGYDLDGRRTSVSGTLAGFVPPTIVPALAYDGSNRLTRSGGTPLAYDTNGNLTGFGSATYSWNARNQLVATSAGAGGFLYDALGRRTSATVNGTTNSYLYDGINPVTISGNLMLGSLNVDDIYAQISSAGTTSYLHDGLNSTVAESGSAGTIGANYLYSPYGDSVNTSAVPTPLQYTGRENDGETGLYYYRARYYSPQIGRFISEDPAAITAGTNFYAYAGGNPVSYRDPLGLYPAIVVTLPNGQWYVPMTTVKNPAQAAAYGLPVGTATPIATPPGANPQGEVNCWANAKDKSFGAFKKYWSDPARNYKVVNGPMYDAYGNFEFGATGDAAGFPLWILQGTADYLHNWNNNPINTNDINSGFNAIAAGGKVSIVDTEIFGGGP